MDPIPPAKKMESMISSVRCCKFGRNALIKAMDMEDGATGQDRNRQIGGHRA